MRGNLCIFVEIYDERMNLREELFLLQDVQYRDFTLPLIPGVRRFIGVRLPVLRHLAKEFLKGDTDSLLENFLKTSRDSMLYMDEIMLWGMVVSGLKGNVEEKQRRVVEFLPMIDNWSVCDSFCWHLSEKEREPFWTFIQPYFFSEKPYFVRFAVVMALRNFMDMEHLHVVLERLEKIHLEDYYVKMSIAWAVSVAYVAHPIQVEQWLTHDCPLEEWTFNRSIQKICESLRVDESSKRRLREWCKKEKSSKR